MGPGSASDVYDGMSETHSQIWCMIVFPYFVDLESSKADCNFNSLLLALCRQDVYFQDLDAHSKTELFSQCRL